MIGKLIGYVAGFRTWTLMLAIVLLSEIFTLIMNTINSYIWWGRLDVDLLLIGTVDAFVVSALVGGMLVVLLNIIRDNEAALKEALEEKTLLIREVNHRVKNNLMILQGLLSLQSRDIKDECARGIFLEGQSRVKAMALIHEQIYSADGARSIRMQPYISSLMQQLSGIYSMTPEGVRLSLEVDDIALDVDTVIPLGLMLNELVTNAFKHARRPGERELLSVSLMRIGGSVYELVVSDNGPGLPEGLDIKAQETLGLKIVSSLAEQIGGELRASGNRGARFSIIFQDKGFTRSREGIVGE